MITAVDTNVLLDVFGADPHFGPASGFALRRCLAEGALVACEIVWAEAALAFPNAEQFTHAMKTLPVTFSAMSEKAAIKAAEVWRRYRAEGGRRNRIASDFLIGAHSLTEAERLLTRDRGFYREYFSGLTVLEPSA